MMLRAALVAAALLFSACSGGEETDAAEDPSKLSAELEQRASEIEKKADEAAAEVERQAAAELAELQAEAREAEAADTPDGGDAIDAAP